MLSSRKYPIAILPPLDKDGSITPWASQKYGHHTRRADVQVGCLVKLSDSVQFNGL